MDNLLNIPHYAAFLCAAHESFAACPNKLSPKTSLRGRYRAWRNGPDKTPKPWKPMLKAALELANAPTGCILEFGVYNGNTLNLMSKLNPKARLHGFDSFTGFPDDGRADWHQDMAVAQIPEVSENIQLHVGYFEQTLPEFAASHQGELDDICLIHIDCDLYSSTKTVFSVIGPYLRPGQLIVFDELMNYREFAENEFLAFYEFLLQHDLDFEWAITVGNAFPFAKHNARMTNQRFGFYRAQKLFQNQAIRLVSRDKGQHMSGATASRETIENLRKQLKIR
jgi:hypothetical protein